MREGKRPHKFSLVLGSSRGVRLAHMGSRILWRADCSLLPRLESMLDREAVSESEKYWSLQLVFSTFFGCQRLAVSSICRNDSMSVCGSLFSCKNPAPTCNDPFLVLSRDILACSTTHMVINVFWSIEQHSKCNFGIDV